MDTRAIFIRRSSRTTKACSRSTTAYDVWERRAIRGRAGTVVHGGPGGGCSPETSGFSSRFFRIVLFDQRGLAHRRRSVRHGNKNGPVDCRHREASRVSGHRAWLISAAHGKHAGEAYARRITRAGFVLRGIFLGRQSEIDWFLYGLRTIFPEAWNRFAGMLPPAERKDLLKGYLKRLFDADARVYLPFARAWSEYEGSCSTLLPNPELVRHFADEALGLARMEAHYFAHQCFLAPNQLLNNLDRIRHLPASIVQARYDMVCPIVNADELARAWPSAKYTVVADAGHSVWEPSVSAAVVAEVDRMKLHLAR